MERRNLILSVIGSHQLILNRNVTGFYFSFKKNHSGSSLCIEQTGKRQVRSLWRWQANDDALDWNDAEETEVD